MSKFFTELAGTLNDRQEVRLNITKVGNDLVVLAVPDFKNKGNEITVSGSPEDLDAGFIDEFKKPIEAKASGLISNADAVTNDQEEEETEEEDPNTPSCSLAEALEKQDLFINSMLSQLAAGLIWKMFREGKIDYQGAFLNLKTLQTAKISL